MTGVLGAGLPALGVDPACAGALEAFARLVLKKNEVMNLTAITDPRDVAALHLLDSLSLLGVTDFSGRSLLDVGTGAGFPGMPIAIARRDCRVTLLDSQRKRVDFLEEAREALSLANVTCVHGRAEELAAGSREGFSIVASRAVAELRTLCELCLPYAAVGGVFLAMKSVGCDGELSAAGRAIGLLGGEVEAVVDYPVPATEVVHRCVVIRKKAPTPGKYPRRFAQIKKQPL